MAFPFTCSCFTLADKISRNMVPFLCLHVLSRPYIEVIYNLIYSSFY